MFHRYNARHVTIRAIKALSLRARIAVLTGTLGLGLAATFAAAGGASASASFDPISGTGFVGKGDVQQVFALNNKQIQADALNVKFAYNETDSSDYAVTCQFDTGSGSHVVHHVINTTDSLSDTVAYDATSASRTNPKGNVTGFNLTGSANQVTTSSGAVPQVGDSCPGNSGLGPITAVSGPANQSSDQHLSVSDGSLSPAATALDGANVWHLTNGANPVSLSANFGTSNGSVY
jgi:hypothetical protein